MQEIVFLKEELIEKNKELADKDKLIKSLQIFIAKKKKDEQNISNQCLVHDEETHSYS